MNEILNPILEVMKKRIGPLLILTCKANKQIDQARKNGYKLDIECWGTTGWRPTINNIKLSKFSKDLVESGGKAMTPTVIKKTFEKITEELKQLEKEQYCLKVTGRRPNGRIALHVDSITMKLTSNDYSQEYDKL